MELGWLLAPPLPSGVPRQRLLYQRLRAAVADGRLPSGTLLPASRKLATALGIARNSVLFAYEQLAAEGCLVADRHGTRVAALPRHDALPAPAATLPGLAARALAAVRPGPPPNATTLPFSPGVPDLGAFPFKAWRACLERSWRAAGWRQLGYAAPGGEPALRAALAAHLATVRGFAVDPEQVVITGGTQSGLELCARLLCDAGDTAWVENPGYPVAWSALTLAGLNLHAVSVDEEGMAPAAEDWRTRPPRLILLTPSHQYPTGRVMTLARRLTLIDRARAVGAWIVEDDYDSEFRRSGPALPAIYGLRHDAPVIYAGTFSKTLYPALRIGYLVLPRPLAGVFVRAAAQVTRAGQGIEQAALADFISRGHYTAHLRRMRLRYAARHAALRQALRSHPGAEVAISGGEAGLHLVLWLAPALCDRDIAARAATLGLGVRALSDYVRAPATANGLVLGYGNLDEGNADAAVRRLRMAMAVP